MVSASPRQQLLFKEPNSITKYLLDAKINVSQPH
jgi:hypothetical protein